MTKEDIIKIVEKHCPELVKACKAKKADSVIFHQLAFNEDELLVLGAAVKYIGYYNKDVVIVKEKRS